MLIAAAVGHACSIVSRIDKGEMLRTGTGVRLIRR